MARHLEPVRLIGEDIEIRAPILVALRIRLTVCVDPEVWLDDVRSILEQELSDGYTPDGRLGFFHPDRWTFGRRCTRARSSGASSRCRESPSRARSGSRAGTRRRRA